ncbi:SOS response-associated peptidase family protein [Mesorhizobium sp. 113-3-3]|uniref:SOS response-associated peptidase family protein n=1 Tax=Mesorhizobium sp. 113-3-3 TaxID=2744516 RepID=UPI0018EABABE
MGSTNGRFPADGEKDPWQIYLPEPAPFFVCRSLVGLADSGRRTPIVAGCTIIAASAGGPMKNLHDRQPVIPDRACYEAWLDRQRRSDARRDAVLGRWGLGATSRALQIGKNRTFY